jgi:hypothetical protein
MSYRPGLTVRTTPPVSFRHLADAVKEQPIFTGSCLHSHSVTAVFRLSSLAFCLPLYLVSPPGNTTLAALYQDKCCAVRENMLSVAPYQDVCHVQNSSITFYAGRSAFVFTISRTRSPFGVQSPRLYHCQPCLGYRIYSGAPSFAEYRYHPSTPPISSFRSENMIRKYCGITTYVDFHRSVESSVFWKWFMGTNHYITFADVIPGMTNLKHRIVGLHT